MLPLNFFPHPPLPLGKCRPWLRKFSGPTLKSNLKQKQRSNLRSMLRRVALRTPALARGLALPPHSVVGLPALSPTMTQGNIAKYVASVGDQLTVGDRLAEIETADD